MAYIPGFTYDIFISYSHIDNELDVGETDGWVTLFNESFRVNLEKLIGVKNVVKIWWDNKKIDGSKIFNKTIEEGVQSSAIMICLISNSYLKSDYCRQEREMFHKEANNKEIGLTVEDESRIIKVFLYDIDYNDLPKQFDGSTGHKFFNKNGKPLKTDLDLFEDKIYSLVDSVYRILNAISKKDSAKMPFVLPRPTPKTDFNIYFAEVSETLLNERRRLMKDLGNNGYSITTIPANDDAENYMDQVKKAMQNADLCVHLLTKAPGLSIEGTNTWVPQSLVELSLQNSSSRLIWVPSDLSESDIVEDLYRSFIHKLENNIDPENKYEFIRGNFSELAKQIMDHIKAISKSIFQELETNVSVLVDNHKCDNKYAYKLGFRLEENKLSALVNPYQDEPRKSIDELTYRISRVNKLVFLYGNVSHDYVKERVNAALQLIVNNNYPIKDFYIYAAPPLKSAEELNIKPVQQYLKVNVMNDSTLNELNDEVLDKFITEIKRERV